MKFVEIDGSAGEGGGQILRTAMSLSSIAQVPLRITNIRAKRKEPGLRPQHLQAVLSASTLCNGTLRGAEVGSTDLEYIPQKPQASFEKRIDTGTAGSISLIAQTIVPISIFAGTELDVRLVGGTEVPNSPTIDYIANVVKPVYEKLGADLWITIERRGYYPRGGGIVSIHCKQQGTPAPNFDLVSNKAKSPKETRISVLSVSRSLPDHVGMRQLQSARAALKTAGYMNVEEIVDSSGDALSPGSSVLVFSKDENSIVGASSLGERGKRAELVGEEAAKEYIKESSCNPGVDSHLADMLVAVLPCIKGSGNLGHFTTPRITEHLKTNVEVVRQFFPDCTFDLKAPNCEGNHTNCWKVSASR